MTALLDDGRRAHRQRAATPTCSRAITDGTVGGAHACSITNDGTTNTARSDRLAACPTAVPRRDAVARDHPALRPLRRGQALPPLVPRWSPTARAADCTSNASRATGPARWRSTLILVGGLFAVVFVTILVLTIPDIPVPLTLAICVPIVVLGPIVAYPFSKTIWVAVDRAFLQQLDVNEAATNRVAASDPGPFLRTRAAGAGRSSA